MLAIFSRIGHIYKPKKMSSKNLLILLILMFSMSINLSCSDDTTCDQIFESYIQVDEHKIILDPNDSEIYFYCRYIEEDEIFTVGYDDLFIKFGDYKIDDALGIIFKFNELKEGSYDLVIIDENLCDNDEIYKSLEENTAIAGFEIDNCCGYINHELGEVSVKKCEDNFIIRIGNLEYNELKCDRERETKFMVSFQLVCAI